MRNPQNKNIVGKRSDVSVVKTKTRGNVGNGEDEMFQRSAPTASTT